jgi:hypothetical protein
MVGASQMRGRGWCHRVVAHSTLRDRWRNGKYKRRCAFPGDIWDAYLLYDGTYVAMANDLQLNVWEIDDSSIESLSPNEPIRTIPLPLDETERLVIPLSEISMSALVVADEYLFLVNIDTGDVISAQLDTLLFSAVIIASHGHPNQPIAYVADTAPILEEWDLCTMAKSREIPTPNCSGACITMSDDHTFARTGFVNEPQ